jgi:TP901 family phage tail tape measure protein
MPSSGTVATAYVQLLPSAEGLQKAMEDAIGKPAEQSSKKNGEKSGKTFVEKMGSSMTKFGKSMTKYVTVPLAAIGGASIAAASTFDSSMAKLSTIADTSGGKGSKSISQLRTEIMNLSNETGISASYIAESAYQAISAGQKTSDSIKFVAASAKLAKAGFTDMGTATDTLTTALNAYGMKASKVTKVSDILMTTQNLGKTTIGELGASMGKVIPTAAAYGVNLKQLASAYVTTTKNGIATAESGTYINSMLNELGKSGTKASDMLKAKTGKSFKELMDSGMSLTDVLKILQDGAKESGLSINDMFGSAEAGKAASTLMQHSKDFKGALDQMGKSAGTTQTAYEKMEDSFSTSLEKMKNSATNGAIAIGGAILPVIEPMIKNLSGKLQNFAKWFSGLSQPVKQFIVVFGGIAAAVGPSLVGIGKVLKSVGEVKKAFGDIFKYGGKFISGVSKYGGKLVSGFSKVGSTIVSGISKFGSLVFNGLKNAVNGIGSAFSALGSFLAANPFVLIIAAIAAAVVALVLLYNKSETFRNFVNGAVSAIQGFVVGAWNTIKAVTFTVFSAIQTFFVTVWNGIKTVFTTVVGGISTFLSGAWSVISTVVTTVWNGIKTFFGTIWSGITTVVTTYINIYRTIITTVFNAIKMVIMTIWNGIKMFFTTVWNGIVTVVTTYVNIISTVITTVFNAIKAVVAAIWNGIKIVIIQPIQSAWKTVSNVVKTINSGVSNGFNAAKNAVSSAWSGVKEIITRPFREAWNVVKGVVDKLKGAFNFKWRLPHFDLPHLSVSGGKAPWGIGGQGSLPQFHVNWYAKGGIFDAPSVIGVGEAGPEAVLPIEKLQTMLNRSVVTAGDRTINNEINITINGAEGQDVEALSELVADEIISRMSRLGAMVS